MPVIDRPMIVHRRGVLFQSPLPAWIRRVSFASRIWVATQVAVPRAHRTLFCNGASRIGIASWLSHTLSWCQHRRRAACKLEESDMSALLQGELGAYKEAWYRSSAKAVSCTRQEKLCVSYFRVATMMTGKNEKKIIDNLPGFLSGKQNLWVVRSKRFDQEFWNESFFLDTQQKA